jgi:hypothetical protein
LFIDNDTGLCLPASIQETAFGQLAVQGGVPLCTAVPALPAAAPVLLMLLLTSAALWRHRGGTFVARHW